jgi:hypothetical protein
MTWLQQTGDKYASNIVVEGGPADSPGRADLELSRRFLGGANE